MTLFTRISNALNDAVYYAMLAGKRAYFRVVNLISPAVRIGKVNRMRFYKEDGMWFVDLPQWKGAKWNLLMVQGADTLLDNLNQGTDDVVVDFSLKREYLDDSTEIIHLKGTNDNPPEGRYYDYEFHNVEWRLWLCDVSAFVFGYHPNNIYFKQVR